MKNHLLIGAAFGAIVLTGVGVSTGTFFDSSAKAPFLHPLIQARAACSGGEDGFAARRAYFLRMASAYADTLPASTIARTDMLNPGLGQIGYKISTGNQKAQAWFDQGLALSYNFNHVEAIKAFKRAQLADPNCAMCFWGEAFAHGPNINAPMFPDAVAPAWDALQKAQSLKANGSAKEQALIEALAKRYRKNPPADRAGLDNAFADAMDKVALEYPADDFIAALAAEANMDTRAWDYWEGGGRTPKGRTARTISLLEGVLARNPEHTASIHLYIHITEASANPYRAVDHADRLANLTPGLGHLIHMPSHTYFRIGRFEQSLAHNIRAVDIDTAYLETADASILYEYGYYTHNIHFAMTSAQMAGDGETALMMAKLLDSKLPLDMAAAAPWVQPIKAAPYYAMVQFGAPEDILNAEDPGDALPFLKGIWHYARGEAKARIGDSAGAMNEVTAISDIIANADLGPLVDGGVPAIDILNIARLTVIARAHAGGGAHSSAIEAMEEAVEIQDNIAYTEPPYWYYPSKQTLAAMLLDAGEAERAEQLFLEALTYSPNNAFVLFGLSKSYEAQNDKNGAKFAGKLFKDAWLGDKKAKLSLGEL